MQKMYAVVYKLREKEKKNRSRHLKNRRPKLSEIRFIPRCFYETQQ